MATPFIDFRPAEVKVNKEVYVAYYVLDPASDKLKRMRVRCNRIKNRRKSLQYASLLCANINRKLYSGWNPLIDGQQDEGGRHTLVDSAIRYVHGKEGGLRKDSIRGYKSKLSFFVNWCHRNNIDGWLCKRFTSTHATRILSEYGDSGHGAWSYNSMLQFLKGMFRSFTLDGLCALNPFESLKGKTRSRKHRTTILKSDRKRILNYFQKRGMTEYIVMIRLCFKYLVRPKEMLMMQVGDIDMEEGLLHIPPEVSKNHAERTIALGRDVMKYFQALKRSGHGHYNQI